MTQQEEIQKLVDKVKEFEKNEKTDLSSGEDLSVAIMNLISIEEHLFFTGSKTGNKEYLDILLQIRDMRKELLKKYPDISKFRSDFKLTDAMFEDLIAFGEKKGVPRDSAGLAVSSELIKVQLTALLARDLWNTDAYWQVINDINPFYIKAMESLKNDTFERMKIAEK